MTRSIVLSSSPSSRLFGRSMANTDNEEDRIESTTINYQTRRSLLLSTILTPLLLATPNPAHASLGTLPELSTTNAILQGLTVNIADQSQLDAMVAFLESSFSMKVLRQRVTGSVTEVWMGYGPEMLGVPEEFEVPVSSFGMNGGHGSIRLRLDGRGEEVYYRKGEMAPGDNFSYLQLGVPEYRISQMQSNGGTIIDAYGFVNVVSPVGLPIRAIVGISPDPIMFVAINCQNVEESREFYNGLGFVEQPYPYARPQQGEGQFEPSQPEGSVYLSPSPNCMGILLLSSTGKKQKKGQKKPKKPLKPNPVLQSLDVVYNPSAAEVMNNGETMAMRGTVVDPSQVKLTFIGVEEFEKEERGTRGNGKQKKK